MSQQRDQFRTRVEFLVQQVEDWARPHEWVTKRYPKRMRDVDRQVFEVPALFLQKGAVRVLLDPIAYDVPGSDAAVDLYLMPTYDDMATLYFERGAWAIRYAPDSNAMQSAVDAETFPLSEKTLNRILDSIADHAIPSI